MSDVGWGSDHLEPPKKRTIPIWVWGCAGGCMFAIGAAVVFAIYVAPVAYRSMPKVKRWFEEQTTQEVQWPRLAEVLPFDEQPAGFTIAHAPIPFVDIWQLDSEALDLVVFVFSGPDGGGSSPFGKWFSAPKEAPMFRIQDGEFEAVDGQLILQGRELRAVRFTRTGLPEEADVEEAPRTPIPPTPLGEPDSVDPKILPAFANSKSIRGDGLALDVTPESSERRVLVWLVRTTAGTTVSDEEAKSILAPFKIGPAR